MPFNAPASVPQITYTSYPPQQSLYFPPGHSSLGSISSPPPTKRDVQTNRKLNQHFVSIKAALRSMLRTRHLPNLPIGFPFRCVRSSSGRADAKPHLSYSSYEFFEYVVVDQMSPPSCALFSYTAPTYGTSPSKMTWRIKIPSPDSMFPNDPRTFITVSQVDVDPQIMQIEPFGYEFMTEEDMLLEALSISLEHGLHLTVQLALPTPGGGLAITENCCDDFKSRGYRSRDAVIFVAKTNDGQREMVHLYNPRTIFPRKS